MERRRAIRRNVSPDEPLGHARLRTGGRLRIIEASSLGALVEATERLLPGRHLDVHIVSAEGRMLVRCRVARAFVAKVDADTVRYQAGFSFDRSIDVRPAGYGLPSSLVPADADRGMPYPERPSSRDIAFADSPSTEESAALPGLASPLV